MKVSNMWLLARCVEIDSPVPNIRVIYGVYKYVYLAFCVDATYKKIS
jgi:hypothetical protein